MTLHMDTGNPHVQLMVRNLGHDWRRLHVKKGDPQKWREAFAAELERQGVEAAATPRATRGVIKRGQPSSAPHSRERLDTTGVPDEVPGGPRRLPRTAIRSSTVDAGAISP
ncbi:hypothetical protein [Modicisalibacter radicis]